MRANRFADFVLLLSYATSLCLTLVFVLWADEEGRSLFGSIGYCGALIYIATGACLDVEHRGGIGRLLRWGTMLQGLLLAVFAVAAVPVALSPRAGEVGFDPDALCLAAFEGIWIAFQTNLAVLVILIALSSTRGWSRYLASRGRVIPGSENESGAGKRRRRIYMFGVLLTAYLGFLAIGCLLVTPSYTFPLIVRLMSAAFLVGIVLAADGQVGKKERPDAVATA